MHSEKKILKNPLSSTKHWLLLNQRDMAIFHISALDYTTIRIGRRFGIIRREKLFLHFPVSLKLVWRKWYPGC